MTDRLRGHDETIGERLKRDLAALQTPPLRRLRDGVHNGRLLAVAGSLSAQRANPN
jgi:hypothetical protein